MLKSQPRNTPAGRRERALLAALAAGIVFAAAGCTRPPERRPGARTKAAPRAVREHATLRVLTGNSTIHTGQGHVHVNQSWVWGTFDLCTTGGPIRLINVTLARRHGPLTLLAWGVRHRYPGDPYAGNPGSAREQLTAEPGFTHRPVSVPCGARNQLDQLAVSTALSRATPGNAQGLRIQYRQGGIRASAFSPFAIAMCPNQCPDA